MALVCFPCVEEFHFSLLCGLSIESGYLYFRYRPYHIFHCSKLIKLMSQSKWSCPYSTQEDVWKNAGRDQLNLNFGIRHNWSGQPHATHTAPPGETITQNNWMVGWVGRYLPGIKPRFIGGPDNYADHALPVTGEVLFISVCFME